MSDTRQEWFQALTRINEQLSDIRERVNEQLSDIRERVARMEARFDELASGRELAMQALNKAEAAMQKAEAAHALASDLHDDRKKVWHAILANALGIIGGIILALWKGGGK
ncbi:MAG TPA: hypothetical protein VIK75_09650 [Calditerricola sp.]